MKRAWKWLRRVGIAAAVLVAVILVAWVTLVPGIVRRIATRQLQGMGLRDVALQVRGVSLGHVQLANVAAGEGERLRVGAVGVGFSLGGLLRGRLRVIELTGLETEICFRDGRLDLGPLADMGTGGEGENPFTQIQLRSSAILLDLEGHRLRIPVEGTVNDAGKGRVKLDLRAGGEGADVRVEGTVDTNTNDFYLTLDGEVREVASLLAALPPRWLKTPPHVSGPVTLKALCHGGRDTWSLEADVEAYALKVAAELPGHQFSAKELDLSGKVKFRDGQLAWLSGNASAFGLAMDGLRLQSAGVYGGMAGKEVAFEARLRGDGWSLEAMMGRATGVLDALCGKPSSVAIESAWWTCSLDPQRLLADVPALRDSLQIASPKPISIAGENAVLRLTPPGTGPKSAWSWALDVPKAEATWRSAELRLPASGVELNGVEAKLPITLQATPEQVTLRLAAGSRLTVSEAKLLWLDVRQTAQEPLLTLELGAKGLEAKVPLGGEKPDWSLDIPELVVKQAEADLALPIGLGKVEGVRGNLALGLKAGPNRAVVNALPRCLAEIASAAIRLGQEQLRLGPIRLSFAQDGDKPLATIEPGRARPVSVAFGFGTARESGPVAVSVAGAEIAVGQAQVSGLLGFGDGRPPAVNAKVSLDKMAVQHKASGLAVAGLSAEVPVSWNSKEPATGKFAIERIEAGGVKLANVGGTLAVADGKAEFSVAAEPLKGAKVSVEGSLDASRGTPSGFARVSLPLFQLADEQELGRLVPALRGVLASGTFGLEGYARLAGGQVRPTLTLTVLDGAFKSRQWEADAEGVFATVRLSSVTPPLTPRKELQIALVKHAKLGGLDVRDGFLAFRLEPAEAEGKPSRWRAFVQRAEWGWCGGRLYAEAVEFDPQAPEHSLTLHADDLKLAELLALIPEKRATGVGALSGSLPVTIGAWPDLRFGAGGLRSAPDQKGWLQIRDMEPLKPGIEAVVQSSVPRDLPAHLRPQAEEQIRDRLTNALKDIEYDELKADFTSRKEGLLTTLSLRGRARQPDRAGQRQEFAGLVFNFANLDTLLKEAILIKRDVSEGPRR